MSSTLKVQNIAHTGGTNAMTIDSSGRINQPAKPAFFAYLTVERSLSSISVNPIDITQYLTGIDYNIGSCYSAANGFVAPMDGIYTFSAGFYYYNAANAEYRVYKNNSIWQRLPSSNIGTANNPFTGNFTWHMQLSTNDAIKISMLSGNNANLFHGNRNTFFCGYMVA